VTRQHRSVEFRELRDVTRQVFLVEIFRASGLISERDLIKGDGSPRSTDKKVAGRSTRASTGFRIAIRQLDSASILIGINSKLQT
jgi:hypothetical protein